MSMLKTAAAGFAALAVLGLALPAERADAASGGVTCEIKVVKRNGDVEYKGIVHASRATSGTYAFRISQNGSAGSALINQGGDFKLAAGESTVIGEATLGNGRGIAARLAVMSDDGSTLCTR